MKFVAATLLAVAAYAAEEAKVNQFDWNAQFTAKDKTTTMKGDVKFNWTGSHNVREVPDQKAFDDCDKSKAKEIDGGEKSGVVVKGTKGQTRFFICEKYNHCDKGQKVAMTWGDASSKSGAIALQAAGAFAVAALLM